MRAKSSRLSDDLPAAGASAVPGSVEIWLGVAAVVVGALATSAFGGTAGVISPAAGGGGGNKGTVARSAAAAGSAALSGAAAPATTGHQSVDNCSVGAG